MVSVKSDYGIQVMPMRYKRAADNMRKPILFGALLLTLLCMSVYGMVINTGPIVLGTELNTNGHVEYLCLGNGCESYAKMSWPDK